MPQINKYDAENIETLSFKDAVRSRISMYMGSADNNGVFQCIVEIITNSIDEFRMGYGNTIEISIDPLKNIISISDNARGIPFGKRADGTDAMIAAFTTPHSGGKFNDSVYEAVAGMNGIGAKGAALSASEFFVTSCRNKQVAKLTLTKGEVSNFLITKTDGKITGTKISFIPDEEVYNLEPIKIDINRIKEFCRMSSFLNKGLKFMVEDRTTGKKWEYISDQGIKDLLAQESSGSIVPPIYYELTDGVSTVEIAFQWTTGKEKFICFTNGLLNSEGGTSITGFRTSVTRNINKLTNNLFDGETVRTGLVYIISAKVPNASFSNQTKTKVNNPELRSLTDSCVTDALEIVNQSAPSHIEKIKNFLEKEKKAEEAAQRARRSVLQAEVLSSKQEIKRLKLTDKFTDCLTHGKDSMILLCEGNSAAGSIKKGRDPKKHAVIALRGKIINALKHSESEILENEEVQLLISSLGCGIFDKCDARKLRYGKVGIAVDADVDGSSIMCLLLTFFYKFMPDLLKQHKVFWVSAPLFSVKKGKDNRYFYNDQDLEDFTSKNKGYEIRRFKGLGEMDEKNVADTFLSEDNGVLIQFTIEDGELMNEMFEMLMGKDIEERSEFIMDNMEFAEIEE